MARTRDTAESGRGSGKVLVLIAAGPLSWLLAPLLSLPLVLARVKWPPPSTPHAPRQSSCVSSLILLSTLPSVRMAEPLRSLSLSLLYLLFAVCATHRRRLLLSVLFSSSLPASPHRTRSLTQTLPRTISMRPRLSSSFHRTNCSSVLTSRCPSKALLSMPTSLVPTPTPTRARERERERERERPSLYETMSTSYDIPLESRSPA
mgnify:CR=1 FL=1